MIDVPFALSRLNLGTYYYRKRWGGDPIPKRGRYGDCVLFPSYSNVLKRSRPSLIALWERKCKVERASTFKRPSTCLNSLLSPGVEDTLQRNCWLFPDDLRVEPFTALLGTQLIDIGLTNYRKTFLLNTNIGSHLQKSYGLQNCRSFIN